MATYGYRRVSSEAREDGSSFSDQTAKIKALAVLAGLEEPIMFEDVCSASIPFDQRTGGGALWAMLRKGDSVIVAKLDRAFRSAGDALDQADAMKAKGVNLYLTDMGAEAVTSNASKLFFPMLVAVAEFERDRIRERLADGRAGMKSKRGHIGGGRPFGYDVTGRGKEAVLVPRQDEQEAIAEMLALKARGWALRKIAESMKANGFDVCHMTVDRIVKEARANRHEYGSRRRLAPEDCAV